MELLQVAARNCRLSLRSAALVATVYWVASGRLGALTYASAPWRSVAPAH